MGNREMPFALPVRSYRYGAGDYRVMDANDVFVASCWTPEDASALVTAVNAHAELVAMVERYASECGECGGHGFVKVSERDETPEDDEVTRDCEVCADIRALLTSCKREGGA